MCRGQGLTHFKQITFQYASLQSARHAQAETINYITQNTLIISLQTNFMFFRLVFIHVQISCQSNTHYSTPIIGADQQAKVKFFFILRAGYYLCDAINNLRCLLAADSRIPIYKLFTRRILFRFLSKCPVLPQVFLIGRKIAKYLDFNFQQFSIRFDVHKSNDSVYELMQ